MRGAGKYDALATRAREDAEADAVIVIVLGGNKGSGFSVQARGHVAEDVESRLAGLLRNLADAIERP